MAILNAKKTSGWIMGAAIFLWAILAFINLYAFSYPSMDSWCYFASGVGAKGALHPIAPLLGNFLDSDQVWGRHWPGGPMLLSLLEPWMPQSSVLYVLILMLQWLLVAWLLRALALRLFRSVWWANLAAILFLGDRLAFDIAWFYRSEFLTLAGQLVLLLAMHAWTTDRKKFWLVMVTVAAFFEPLLHPVAMAAMGIFVLLGFGLAIRDRRYLSPVLIMAAASFAGVVALVLYYVLQPVALSIFQDHAKHISELTWGKGAQHYVGRTIIHFYENYRPFFITGPLLLLGAAAGGILLFTRAKREKMEGFAADSDNRVWLAVGYWLVSQALISQSSYNGYYLILSVPWAILLCLFAVRYFWEKNKIPRIISWGLVALLLLHLSLWPLRLGKWAQMGFVNYHRSLHELYAGLPEAPLVLIPEVLWEEGLRSSRPVLLNTLPNLCSDEMMASYENYLIERIKPGDILVHDKLQSQNVGVLEKYPACWEQIGESGVNWKGASKPIGFDCVIYRAIAAPKDSRQGP